MQETKLSPELMEMIEREYPTAISEITERMLSEGFNSKYISDTVYSILLENMKAKEVAIKYATLALQQQWVKVSERLPEARESVLAVTNYDRIIECDWEPFTNRDKEWFQNHIKYWLPKTALPAAPNDVQQKEK